MKNKKILIYDDTFTSIQTSALEFYRSLMDSGFSIDILLDVSNFQNDEAFYREHDNQVKLIKLFNDKRRFQISRTNKLRYYYVRISNLLITYVKKNIFLISYNKYINLQEYFCIITTSETSLKYAEFISKGKLPVIYYCTELYSEVLLNRNIKTKKQLFTYIKYKRLKKNVSMSDAIIIQDQDRWDIFARSNGISQDFKHLFFPVSINKYSFIEYSPSDEFVKFIKNNYGDKKIIFYPTSLSPRRGCEQIIDAVKKLPDEYILLIHGFNGSSSFIEKLKKLKSKKIIISYRSINYNDLIFLNSIIWCGILYYGEENFNDRFISNSCNKLVAYLQSGKPFITYGNISLKKLVSEFNCGISLNELSEESMIEAIGYINENYEQLKKNSIYCFNEKYDAKKNIALVSEYLKHMEGR